MTPEPEQVPMVVSQKVNVPLGVLPPLAVSVAVRVTARPAWIVEVLTPPDSTSSMTFTADRARELFPAGDRCAQTDTGNTKARRAKPNSQLFVAARFISDPFHT